MAMNQPPSAPPVRTITAQIDLRQAVGSRTARVDALLRARDLAGADALLRTLEAETPGDVAVRHARAQWCFHRQQWSQAEALWDALRKQCPDHTDIVHGHAATLLKQRRHDEAWTALRAVVQRWPDFLPGRLNLASLLRQAYRRPADALAVLEPALARHGQVAMLHFGIARARQDLLDTEGTLAGYQRALELAPQNLRAFTAYPFCSHYLPHPDLAALRRWVESHGQALQRPGAAMHHPPRAPGAVLRVGLLSGDWRNHPVAYFLETVLAALRRRGVDLVAYSTGDEADDTTARLRASVVLWRDAAAWSDRELAQRIADDRLDVLLDLSGFTTHQRLGTLLMKPAPVQISWLGYFGTLGVPEVDAVIADPHCVPPDESRFFRERVLHMPHTRLCFSPPADAPEPAAEPPMAAGAGLRLACLQNLHKINARVLAAWKRILDGAPDATLLIQGRQLAQPGMRERFEGLLQAAGLDRGRIELRKPCARADYLKAHDQIDLLLDTFPYPGGTTTCEAIWMGVPTLTLATPGMLGRQGQAMLHQVGLDDWITHSDDAYVQRAIALAQDRDGTLATLRHLRRTLRETARTSPLFDAETFARDFESLLRRACQEAVAGAPVRPPAGAS